MFILLFLGVEMLRGSNRKKKFSLSLKKNILHNSLPLTENILLPYTLLGTGLILFVLQIMNKNVTDSNIK